jgi:phytanoyl-CoA hydroxylase
VELTTSLRELGFVRVPGVFSTGQLREASAAVDQLLSAWRPMADPDFWSFHRQREGDHVLYRIHNLERKSKAILRLIGDRHFLALVRQLMGEAVPSACALIYKMPDLGAEIPWHRDPIDVPPLTVFNFSIFLDPTTPENGPLAFVPSSHLHDREYPAGWPQQAVTVPAEVGDVVVHDVRIYHGSDRSGSPAPRRSIVTEFQPNHLAPRNISATIMGTDERAT